MKNIISAHFTDLLDNKIGKIVPYDKYGWDIETGIIRFDGKQVELEEGSDVNINNVDFNLNTLLVMIAPDDSCAAGTVDQAFCCDVDGALWWLDILNDSVAYKVVR